MYRTIVFLDNKILITEYSHVTYQQISVQDTYQIPVLSILKYRSFIYPNQALF